MTTKTAKSRKIQFDPAEFDRPGHEPPPADEVAPDDLGEPESQINLEMEAAFTEAGIMASADLDSPEAIAACQERGAIALKAMTSEANPTVAKYRAIAEIEDQLVAQNLTFREAEIEFNRADKHAKSLKKAMEAEQSRLNGLVQNLSDAMSGNYTPSLPFPDESPESEAWRMDLISILGLSTGIQAALVDAGIRTIGDLADWTASGKQLTDIPAIGEGKAEKINLALDEYWSSRQRAVAGLPDRAGDTLNGNVTTESSADEVASDAIPDAVGDE